MPDRNIISFLLLLPITACQTGTTNTFAYDIPSAIVEIQQPPSEAEISKETRVVVLGTGSPIPDPRRAGPGIAVIHKGRAYLFDAGAGVIKNAATARYQYDIPSLYPLRISAVFLTHLHSDHIADIPVLASTLWWRRVEPLKLLGPAGAAEMIDGMYAMMAPDVRIRSAGSQPVPGTVGIKVDVREITPGLVFEAEDIKVEAFGVDHGDIKSAYGYRITTHDRVIVISGDTAASEKLAEMARGADLLFHEVISDSGLLRTSEAMQAYHKRSHTLASELGQIASKTRPGRLILYHGLYYGIPEETVLDEVRAAYDGDVVLADDLDIF